MNQSKRIQTNLQWIENLRVLATISVIVLHVAANLVAKFGKVSNFDWWIGNIYESFVRFGVPIFLMISGSLLLSKTYESTSQYLKKRILKILLPFVFWSSIYIVKDYFFKIKSGEVFNFLDFVKFYFLQLKNGASFHLWYIYLIIGLYLVFPIFSKWLNNSKKNEIEYFLFLWLISIFTNLPIVTNLMPNVDITYFSGYIGFPILGYYLTNYTSDLKNKKIVYILLIIAGFSITVYGTYFFSNLQNTLNEFFYVYTTINVLMISTGIFMFFKEYVEFSKKTNEVISFFSKYSYGVYLIHVLVLFGLVEMGFSYEIFSPVIGIPIMSILCFLIAVLIIYCLNKLPFGKFIAG